MEFSSVNQPYVNLINILAKEPKVWKGAIFHFTVEVDLYYR